jgi:hypothetical protein
MKMINRWTQESYGADFQIAHPSYGASLIWVMILTLAVIGGTLALSCVTPFAALAVALVGTVSLRASLRTMTLVWFVNQVVGFGFFHFLRTANTFLWGLAIGAATLLTTIIAGWTMKRASSWAAPARLGVALVLSFAVYEGALLPATSILGGRETFAPVIVLQFAIINAASLVGIVALNEVAVALCKRWLGRMPRLIRSW